MKSQAAVVRRGDVVRIRASRWRITSCAGYGPTVVVDATGCDATNRAERARFLLPFEPLDRIDAPAAPAVVRPARWRHTARPALADACPSWTSLRTAARANLTPIPFQLEPALALARGDACRFLIADSVGLGKTVEAGLMLAEILERRPEARAIVIAPAGLRDQWRLELRTRFNLDAQVLDAAHIATAARQLPGHVNPWAIQPIAITSIDYVKRPEVIRALEPLVWDLAVFDEAHNLTGRSDRAAAAGLLASRARVVVLLTATPHTGDDGAFKRLCELGKLGSGEPLAVFRRTRADAGLADAPRSPLLRVRPTADEAVMHEVLMAYVQRVWRESPARTLTGARLAASVLARRACSSAYALARSAERRLMLLSDTAGVPRMQPELPFGQDAQVDEAPQWQLGTRGLSDAAAERQYLQRLLALAVTAAASESKIAALRRLLSRIEEPAIVFTEYRDTLQRLAGELGDAHPLQLHGGLTPRERADVLRRFTGGRARLLLATDAGSEGLNLHQRCRLVINLELPWTPLRLEQRAGRVDRIGQARQVHAIHLVGAGTCEELTLARLVERGRRQRTVLTLLSRAPDEARIAAAALGREPLPDPAPAPLLPDDVVALDLREDALAENLRVERARALLATESNHRTERRGVITHLRRRRAVPAAPECLWLFKVTVAGANGHLLWEPVVPVRATTSSRHGPSAQASRTTLDPLHPGVQRVLAEARGRLLQELRRSLDRAVGVWRTREWRVTDELQSDDGRLSAGLLQPGLFDRRAEHLAASQASLLTEALVRSEERLADLSAIQQPLVEGCDLIFAVLLE